MPSLAEMLIGGEQPQPTAGRSKLAEALLQNMPLPARNERFGNFYAAKRELGLNPQEQDLYSRHLANLYGDGGVNNPDGSRSTLFQSTVDLDGRTYSIPSVWGGEILPEDQAIEQASRVGFGQFPSYASPEEAQSRYDAMHGFIDQDMDAYNAERIAQASRARGVK
jgi:hypothetical protein